STKAKAGAGASTCPDGSPVPKSGSCPTGTEQGKAKVSAGASQSGQAAGSTAKPAASGASTNGSSSSSNNNNSSSSSSRNTTNVNITTQQQTEIQKEVKVVNVAPVTVHFDVSVGVVVPHRVHLH